MEMRKSSLTHHSLSNSLSSSASSAARAGAERMEECFSGMGMFAGNYAP
jgi:hypothetical protein